MIYHNCLYIVGFASVCACSNHTTAQDEREIDLAAANLNDKAMGLIFYHGTDSIESALVLLNPAIALEPEYFDAYVGFPKIGPIITGG